MTQFLRNKCDFDLFGTQNKDLKAEEQMISALPDVKRTTLTPKDEFMILACDGIWNSLSSEEVVDFVRTRIQKGETKMSAICEEVSPFIIDLWSIHLTN